VALQRPGGAELRRGDRGRRARGARRGDPAQAALPRRRRRPLRLRPREGLRSRYAGSHASPSYFGSSDVLFLCLIWEISWLRRRCSCAVGERVRAPGVGRADSQMEARGCTHFCPLNNDEF
jgi:hypothetical protein